MSCSLFVLSGFRHGRYAKQCGENAWRCGDGGDEIKKRKRRTGRNTYRSARAFCNCSTVLATTVNHKSLYRRRQEVWRTYATKQYKTPQDIFHEMIRVQAVRVVLVAASGCRANDVKISRRTRSWRSCGAIQRPRLREAPYCQCLVCRHRVFFTWGRMTIRAIQTIRRVVIRFSEYCICDRQDRAVQLSPRFASS